MRLTIDFVDSIPFQHSWLPWEDDHFRISYKLENISDDTLTLLPALPCNDCNPKLNILDASTGEWPAIDWQMDVFYLVDEDSFIDLPPGGVHRGAIDWCEYLGFDLEKGEEYLVWLEYCGEKTWTFGDSTRTTRIWNGLAVSDTLRFTYR